MSAAIFILLRVKILKLENIIGIADPMNIGSCRVLEKVGLKFYKFDTYDEDDKKYNWYKISKKQYLTPNSTSYIIFND